MAAQPTSWGQVGMQRGPRHKGEEVPWRSDPAQDASPSAVGGEHSQGLLSLPSSEQTLAVGVRQTMESCPSHLTVYVVFLVFFPVSSKRFSAKVSH